MKNLLKWEVKSKYKMILGLGLVLLVFLLGQQFFMAGSLLKLGTIGIIYSLVYIALVLDFVSSMNKRVYGLLPVHRGKLYLAKLVLGFLVYTMAYGLLLLAGRILLVRRSAYLADFSLDLGLVSLSYGMNLVSSFNLIVFILFIFKKVDQASPNKYIISASVLIFKDYLRGVKNFFFHQVSYNLRSIYSLAGGRFYSLRDLEASLGEGINIYADLGVGGYINIFLVLVKLALLIFFTVFAYRQMEKSVEVGG